MKLLNNELKRFGEVKTNASLAKFTTLHIGGSVQFLVEVSETQKLVELLAFLAGEGISYFMLGGGSNLLWQDELFEGVVIKVVTKEQKIDVGNGLLIAAAGVPLVQLVNSAVKNGLSGLQWAAGVPGTVGGAVRGNAGAMGSETKNSLAKVDVWRDGEVLTFRNEECNFGYRDSVFKHTTDIILTAYYQTVPGDKAAMMQEIMGYIKKRNGRYPALPSAGSFFKNVDFKSWKGDLDKLPEHFTAAQKVPAAWINDQNGLKGYRVGGAMLSKEHGNFIVNVDNATQSDVLKIVEEIQHRAYTTFGIELEPEVVIVTLD